MEKKISSRVVFIKSKNENHDYTIDAINSYISNLDSCKELKFIDYYYINNTDEFSVTNDIYCKAKKSEANDSDSVTSYSLELYSYNLKLGELKNFIEEIKKKYIYEQNNKLGSKHFYFDEKHVSLMRNSDNSIKFSTATSELVFTMTQFDTNKSLKNVFGKHLDVVKERMDLFCNNPDWYTEKGIPYTLGILLKGPPGTGKTSLIKAIAKDTNRHIFNIKLQADTTQTQLKNLFFNETVKVIKNGKNEIYNIPLNERIYVMEDIDCDNDILLDRKYVKNKKSPNTSNDNINNVRNAPESVYDPFVLGQRNYANLNEMGVNSNINSNPNINSNKLDNKISVFDEDTSEQVTLSFFLNLLDGILETPGRILIMTSNYSEKLDNALIRPGRVDINLEVGYCDEIMIKDMFHFFHKEADKKKYSFENIKLNKQITPAQLNKILLDNFNNISKSYSDILEYVS